MNAKEALKDLKEVRGWNDLEYKKRLKIIEKALTQLEFLEKADSSFIFFAGGREAGKSAITMSICNKLKAFEIIKDFAELEGHRIVISIPLVKITENRGVLRNEENEKKFNFLKEILFYV